VRKWVILRNRLVEIASVLRRFPWIADAIKQRQMSILHPYMIEVYIAKDGSETCLSPNPAQGVLRPKRSREGSQARTGV
jgi:hypothetical protein